ncbi:hypothetical protein EVAR_54441_1 [Eumeta japonica]|uniref:Uncharacterized protein n=1 Tax=Eumeta variegata TaxID=151549 RepID=A0A4C1XKU2_EUMVA|nr:hypothetical protein EVAR_54441_1 [Eumeta japonica]
MRWSPPLMGNRDSGGVANALLASWIRIECLMEEGLVEQSFVSLDHESHSTDVVFGRRHRRTSLAQIVS